MHWMRYGHGAVTVHRLPTDYHTRHVTHDHFTGGWTREEEISTTHASELLPHKPIQDIQMLPHATAARTRGLISPQTFRASSQCITRLAARHAQPSLKPSAALRSCKVADSKKVSWITCSLSHWRRRQLPPLFSPPFQPTRDPEKNTLSAPLWITG